LSKGKARRDAQLGNILAPALYLSHALYIL
jgi:hypothetical protein